MSFIRIIDPTEADEPLRSYYAELTSHFGHIPELFKLQSSHPDALAAHLNLYRSLMESTTGLPRFEREAVALAVSVANSCRYSTKWHSRLLRENGGTESLILSLELGENPDSSSRRLHHLIYCARKLTLLPNAMNKEDIQQLRKNGLSDHEIVHFVQVVSYINFTNRLASSLGATPEE